MTALRAGGASDVGRVRTNNEDRYLVDDPLFVVADGMGGHAAGEVASSTAVETLRAAFAGDHTAAGLVGAALRANRAVWDRAQQQRDLRGMGTTLTAAALVEDDGEQRLAIINIGDSRAYLLRGGELEQLTTDHRLVQELIDDGRLPADQADVHPQRNVLTRALGIDADVDVDCLEILPIRGDRFLLCSDGLSGELNEGQIASTLRRLADPQAAAGELIAQARARGGSDNITAVVVDVTDDDDRALAASKALDDDAGVVIPPLGEAGKGEPGPASAGGARSGQAALRRRLITVRVVAFVAVVLVLLGGTTAAIAWYARDSYFVGIDAGRLTIYRGRPGGLLWFQPTVVERTPVLSNAVLASRLDTLKVGKTEPSVAEARRYVTNLTTEAQAHGITAPAGGATSTTVATTPSPVPTSTPGTPSTTSAAAP